MSYCERIAQFAHDKWANVSSLLRSLRTNEQIALFFSKSIIFLFAHKKMSDSLKKNSNKILTFGRFYIFSKVFLYAKDLLIPTEPSEQNERPWGIRSGCSEGMSNLEQIAQVAHQNEQMSKLLTFWASCSFAHFFGKKRVICSKIWWANSFQ